MADEDNFDIDIYGDLDNAERPDAGKVDNVSREVAFGSEESQEMSRETQRDHQTDNNIAHAQSAIPAIPQNDDDSTRDPLATSALYIADLHWWTTEDEIRGWINHAGYEEDLKEITFSEHKVNGKSKGYDHLQFTDKSL